MKSKTVLKNPRAMSRVGIVIMILGIVCLGWGGLAASWAQTTNLNDGAPTAEKRIYIAVGDPDIRKVLMAIDRTNGTEPVASEFHRTLQNNLGFTDLFEMLPDSRFPPARGGLLAAVIDFSSYRALGVEFLVKSSVSYAEGAYRAEVRLFDVNRGLTVLARMYPLVGQTKTPGRDLAHVAGNDIMEELTGIKGIFRTRIAMVCGKERKDVYLMDFDGQNMSRLTYDNNLVQSPNWSWDGMRLLFTSWKPATKGGFLNPNLYQYDFKSGERIILSGAKGLNSGGAYHPNGTQVAYTFSTSGKPEIYSLDLVSKTRRAITQTLFFSLEPSFSPDGRQLAYSSMRTGKPHIYVANADGSSARQLTFAGQYNSSPHWSPLGDKIVFAGQENKRNNFNIFMVDPNGSNLVRITSDTRWSRERPYFSPDGRHIAFASNMDAGVYRVYTMNANGTNVRLLSPRQLGDCRQPAWSPRL